MNNPRAISSAPASTRSESSRPVASWQYGRVSVAIFERQRKSDGESGTFPVVTLRKSYRTTDGQWHHTETLDSADLPDAICGLQKAYEHLSLVPRKESSK